MRRARRIGLSRRVRGGAAKVTEDARRRCRPRHPWPALPRTRYTVGAMLTGEPVRPADVEPGEVLLDLVDRLERETDRRAERELAHEIARHGVAGLEERVLRAFPRVASDRARDTLRRALREAGHPSVRPPRRLASPSRRARRIAASFCLALGAAWLTVALLAGLRGDWAAFAIATLVFFAVVAIYGSYLGRDRHPEQEEPAGPAGSAGKVARGTAD